MSLPSSQPNTPSLGHDITQPGHYHSQSFHGSSSTSGPTTPQDRDAQILGYERLGCSTSDLAVELSYHNSVGSATSTCSNALDDIESPRMTSLTVDSPSPSVASQSLLQDASREFPCRTSTVPRALLSSVSLGSLSASPLVANPARKPKPKPLGLSRAMNLSASPRLPVAASSFLRSKMSRMAPISVWSAKSKSRSGRANKENIQPMKLP